MQPVLSSKIRMSEQFIHVAGTMHAIQHELKPIEKKGKNETQRYNYAKFEDFVEHVRDILTKHDLFLVTTTSEPKCLEQRPTKSGNFQYGVEVAVTVRIFHKTSEWMEIDCYGEGQDSGDKAVYKAVTGGRKYAISCLLGLSTTDDPENDEDDRKHTASSNIRLQKTSSYKSNVALNTPSMQNVFQKINTPSNINISTGEILMPKEEGGTVTFHEIMTAMGNAKTVRDIIETLDMCKGVAMTPAQKENLTKLKNEMKLKVNG